MEILKIQSSFRDALKRNISKLKRFPLKNCGNDRNIAKMTEMLLDKIYEN